MFESHDLVLDFKAEEKGPLSPTFDAEDLVSECSTISASETNYYCSTPTPQLLCKFKKLRVLVKKLPPDIMEKYNMRVNPPFSESNTRASKRLAKPVPGLYLSLHVNKPLNEVMNKKKRKPRTYEPKYKIPDKKSKGISHRSKQITKRTPRPVVLTGKISKSSGKITEERKYSTTVSSAPPARYSKRLNLGGRGTRIETADDVGVSESRSTLTSVTSASPTRASKRLNLAGRSSDNKSDFEIVCKSGKSASKIEKRSTITNSNASELSCDNLEIKKTLETTETATSSTTTFKTTNPKTISSRVSNLTENTNLRKTLKGSRDQNDTLNKKVKPDSKPHSDHIYCLSSKPTKTVRLINNSELIKRPDHLLRPLGSTCSNLSPNVMKPLIGFKPKVSSAASSTTYSFHNPKPVAGFKPVCSKLPAPVRPKSFSLATTFPYHIAKRAQNRLSFPESTGHAVVKPKTSPLLSHNLKSKNSTPTFYIVKPTKNRFSYPESTGSARTTGVEIQLKKNTSNSSLPNLPDVIITKYNMTPNHNLSSQSHSSTLAKSNPVTHITPDLPLFSSSDNSFPQNSSTPSRLTSPTSRQQVFKVQVPPRSFGSALTNTNYAQQRNTTISTPKAFPTCIITAPRPLGSPSSESTENLSNESYQQSAENTQCQKVFQTSLGIQTTENDAIILNSSKVLLINEPLKGEDPLNVVDVDDDDDDDCREILSQNPEDKENQPESDMEAFNESETESSVSAKEPEVIKRIIYHTKAVQTKFTCNSSICGLIDSDEFNLNCFYCYDIFPLHKWQEFKNHIQQIHHVEEKENETENETDEEREGQQDEEENENSSTANKTVTQKNVPPSLSEPVIYKKLPLEPRLVAERLNKINAELNKSKESNQSLISNEKSPAKSLDSSHVSGISGFPDTIILESDEEDDENTRRTKVGDKEGKAKNLQQERIKINSSQLSMAIPPEIDEVTKFLPKNITIKKVESLKTDPKIHKPNSLATITSLAKPYWKVPGNFNMQQQIIKTETVSANGEIQPRYFMVKQVLKPLEQTFTTNFNRNDSDIKHIRDEHEDDVPKPTNGRGILFGQTNAMVVIEFLLKLKTFPELWRPQQQNKTSAQYLQSISRLCNHLNNRFDLNIQNVEICLSIRRVKAWYYSMLKNIYEHNKISQEPYKHRFPLYFKILQQFLSRDIPQFKSVPKKKVTEAESNIKTSSQNIIKMSVTQTEGVKLTFPANVKPKELPVNVTPQKPRFNETSLETSLEHTLPPPPPVTPKTKDSPSESVTNLDDIIEFDADILYDNVSSEDEALKLSTNVPQKIKATEDKALKVTTNVPQKIKAIEMPKKKRTKIYAGYFECDQCHKVYKRQCDLKRHRVLHFAPQYECAVCGQKFYFKHWAEKCPHFKKKNLLKVKNKVQKNNGLRPSEDETIIVKPMRWPKKPFICKLICELCGASYKQLGSLNAHKRDKHLNQRLKCVVCNFTALTNYRILHHQRKRHIVEPGTPEEVAKKSRARTDTKTPFSVEARQEFFWRREMKKKHLKPGEKFYACCKCRIIFNTRKEKVLHNKMEHPITEFTVLCLLCLPNKFLLSNSNGARRHYTDRHKVPWNEIDALVKRTKPIFNILSKEEIDLLNSSENYKQLLEEILKDRNLEPVIIKKQEPDEDDEALRAVQSLAILTQHQIFPIDKVEEKEELVGQEHQQQQQENQNVYIDGIMDHDYNNTDNNQQEHNYISGPNTNDHDYSEDQSYSNQYGYIEHNGQLYVQHNNSIVVGDQQEVSDLAYAIEGNEEDDDNDGDNNSGYHHPHNDQQYLEGVVVTSQYVEGCGEFVQGDLVEEHVIEECIDQITGEDEGVYF